MSNSNNLRPYYDHDTFDAGYSVIFKPGVGLLDTTSNKPLNSSLASSIINQTNKKNFNPRRSIGIKALDSNLLKNSNDKNYVYDLEFHEYFDFNNLSELFKNLIWNFFKNYCKSLLTQPLEIVRLVLQVGTFDFNRSTADKKQSITHSRLLGSNSTIIDNSDSDSEYEINYFQSSTQSSVKPKRLIKPSKKKLIKSKNKNKIQPVSKHTMDIMSAIVAKGGPFALFRGINASFIHQTLSHTIEAWITGFISPFLGIPDPFFLDLTHSTDPLKSLWLSVSACVLTGLILMPLDLVKVRLMITQFNKPLLKDEDYLTSAESSLNLPLHINTRSIRESICNYPLHFLIKPPTTITILTILHQFSTSIFRKTAPYILFIKFNIDSYSSPNFYTLVNLFSLILEFFIKLPVENLLRKEQVRFLLKPKSISEDEMRVLSIDNPDEDLIIEFNSGWNEVEDETTSLWQRVKRLGLFNGWRVGVLNVVGFWGYNILKNNGTELKEERL